LQEFLFTMYLDALNTSYFKMAILLFFIISYILLSLSLYKVFEKAGVDPKKALIPGVNFVEWCKLIGRPSWWAALLLIPIVNIFIYAGMCIDMVRSFKKYSFLDSALAVLYAPLAFFGIGKKENLPYDGPTIVKERDYADQLAVAAENKDTFTYNKLREKNPYQKGQIREWTEAIVFAVFAAAFIRMFLIEAYVIPTSSMEGSLNVGDYLFVSKAHYGIRTPKTIAMVPLLHNRMPFGAAESYLEKPSLDFHRLPAIESVDRNDPVVFNYPEGDSVYVTPGRTWSIYDFRRNAIPQATAQRIKAGGEPLVTRPIDKMDHYIKRCIAVGGDTLQIKNRQVYLNGALAKTPTHVQFRYLVKHKGPLNEKKFADWGISVEDQRYYNDKGETYKMLVLNEDQKQKIQSMDASIEIVANNMYWVNIPEGYDPSRMKAFGVDEANIRTANGPNRLLLTLTEDQIGSLKSSDSSIVVEMYDESDRLFPHDLNINKGWNVDNFGPIWIPKKGATITITPNNLATYHRVISVYEGNQVEVKSGRIYINGEQATQYTFKMNYYWMMGDNRHNSEDSRVWGFVPENHVVGKPLFIWFSTKNARMSDGINWDRIFTSADKQ